ncbi:CFI-box-CTERM domain-containing protein [Acidobacteriota bacterium]
MESALQLQPLTLDEFLFYIRNVALTLPIKKRILQSSGQGSQIQRTDPEAGMKDLGIVTPSVSKLIEKLGKKKSQAQNVFLEDHESSLPQTAAKFGSESYSSLLGGTLGRCGYHRLPFVMEGVPESWWSYDILDGCMWTWNQFMKVYQRKKSDGSVGGNNGSNEIAGWIDDSTMYQHYGVYWNNYYGWAHSLWRGNSPCGEIIESDIMFNPDKSWTSDFYGAIGNSDVIFLRPLAMHEFAHTWGMQRGQSGQWGHPETYDYDSPTVVHSYYHNIVEDGQGIHYSDAILFRGAYSSRTNTLNIKDMGVESYYASDELKNSTANTSSFYPGDSITLSNVTVGNMSNSDVSDERLRFYLSTDRDITISDYQIGSSWSWESFGKEKYNVGDYSTTIPQNIPNGTYYIGVIVTVNGFSQDNFTFNNATSFFATITVRIRQTDTPSDGGTSGNKKKCFIATAAYGSSFHPHVKILRKFRDEYLMPHKPGRMFVNFYYKHSPPLAEFLTKHKILKSTVRLCLVPLVSGCYSVFLFGLTMTVVALSMILFSLAFTVWFYRRRLRYHRIRL